MAHVHNTEPCPVCGAISANHDTLIRRSWRHFDTIQFSIYLLCEVLRERCKEHRAKTVTVPWAVKNSRYTLLLEDFAIRILQATRSVEEACKLLGLSWHQSEAIKTRVVKRGLSKRPAMTTSYHSITEKHFRSGHCYISNLVDLQGGRMLDVFAYRTEEAYKALIEQSLSKKQLQQITALALHMRKAYVNALGEKLPQADFVHDSFHISQLT